MEELSYIMHKRNRPMLVITTEQAVIDRIEEYRWTNRIQSRSRAAEQLLLLGLALVEGVEADISGLPTKEDNPDATGTATAPAGDRDSRRD